MFYFLLFLNFIFANNIEQTSTKEIEKQIQILSSFDINNPDNKLSLMKDLQGTSIILKVKDKDGNKIGVFKPDSGSTLAQGEYAIYKLGNEIGFNIYPASKLCSLNINSLKKVKALLENTQFKKFYGKKHIPHMKAKEKNRKIMISNIDSLIKTNTPLKGVLKVWISDLQFYMGLGTIKGYKNHKINKYMSAGSINPPHEKYIIKQCTKLLDPLGCTYGNSYIDELAHDMSTMLVIDSILGNRDRFPGGNVHFSSLGEVNKKGDNSYYKIARLMALDNGAVLQKTKYPNTKFMSDLKLSKFNKIHIEKLISLRQKKDLQKLLELDDQHYKILTSNFDNTISYIMNLKKFYGEKIWFN